MRPCIIVLLLSVANCLFGGETPTLVDADRDGLPDAFEQSLLRRFLPKLHISARDCDGAPAEFAPASEQPRPTTKNGTLYGQVFRLERSSDSGQSWLEVHYYHLWSRDCGPSPHNLDAEMVSVLLRGTAGDWQPEAWQADYWYAAAHEDTLCDLSHGASAAALSATEHGPDVWVSRDKHASYLDRALCTRGCGKDVCEVTPPMPVPQVINLGEPEALLAGSAWVKAPAWRLHAKMEPYFTSSLLARINQQDQVQLLPARDVVKGARTTIRVAANTYAAWGSANARTGSAIATGAEGASAGVNAGLSSADKSLRKTGRSLKTALGATGSALRKTLHKPVGGPAPLRP